MSIPYTLSRFLAECGPGRADPSFEDMEATVAALAQVRDELAALRDEAAHAFDAGMAAFEAAKEEVRETIARHIESEPTLNGEWYARRVRATPLAGTPFQDRIAQLEQAVEDHDAERGELKHRAEAAGARVKELEAGLLSKQGALLTEHIRVVNLNDALRAELAAETALVEATQAELAAERERHVATAKRVEVLTELLRRFEFVGRKCPECRGWNMSGNGETIETHTLDCELATALSAAKEDGT